MRFATITLLCLGVVGGSLCLAQPYRCEWSVVGQGGDGMSGTAYKCGATVGQAAAGPLAGTAFRALIGYWQAEVEVGIRENATVPEIGATGTRLESVAPNPCAGLARISFSLAAAGPVSLTVHDRGGRRVRTLTSGASPAGRLSAVWRGDDDAGRELPDGVYFCRLAAGNVRQTGKLVLARPGN